MKWLPVVILMLVVGLVAVVTGCGGAVRYDSRLTAADSLMRSDPDSALAVVEGLPLSELATAGDSAYHDLLLTQARYRCYVIATSDSAINRAMAYYRLHNDEQEKLTRAYLYKGAVMEEFGHPDSAMLYYKHAEATAAPDDYFNLGYINMRIGTIYRNQISQDSAVFKHYSDAIHYFTILKDTNYLISCYGDLGAVYGIKQSDSTEYYLTHAIRLAELSKSPKKYTYMSKLAGFCLYHKKDYKETLMLTSEIIQNGRDVCTENQFYYYAALASIELDMIDSAKQILNITPKPQNVVDTMLRNDVIAQIAKNEQDYRKYGATEALNNKVTNEFRDKLKGSQLIKIESDFSRQQAVEERNTAYSYNHGLSLVLLIFGVLLLLFMITNIGLHRTIKKHRQEISAIKAELENNLESLSHVESKHGGSVSDLVAYRISALSELYHSVRVRISDDKNKRIKKIVPLSALLQIMNEKSELLQIKVSNSFWEKMKLSVNGEFNGIVSYVEEKYPNLSKEDIRLFCLYCAKISPQIIKLCMNYDHTKTASNYKRKLIKVKMGLSIGFDEFIDEYMRGNNP